MPDSIIPSSELSSLLKKHRKDFFDSRESVAARIFGQGICVNFSATQIPLQDPKSVESISKELKEFESNSGFNKQTINLENAVKLAHAYKVSPVLLGPLVVVSNRRTRVLKLSIQDDFLEYSLLKSEESQGCNYNFPRERLGSSDVAFVRLDFSQEGSKSDFHRHSGSELIYVLYGKIFMYIESNGCQIQLNEGDIFHFDGQQPHQATCISEEGASIFVIRFNVHDSEDPKILFHRELKLFKSLILRTERLLDLHFKIKKLPPGRPKKEVTSSLLTLEYYKNLKKVYKEYVFPDLRRRATPSNFRTQKGKGLHIKNISGLLNFIDQFYRDRPEQKEVISQKFPNLFPEKPDEIPLEEIDLPTLKRLADTLEIEPSLLGSYAADVIDNMVVLSKNDFLKIENTGGYNVFGKCYRFPKRNLSYSDISLLRLNLEPGEATNFNYHKGYEFAYPISGNIALYYDDDTEHDRLDPRRFADAEQKEFLHYSSEDKHKITNVGVVEADVLIIRFHGNWKL